MKDKEKNISKNLSMVLQPLDKLKGQNSGFPESKSNIVTTRKNSDLLGF